MHHKMFSSVLGLYPPDACSASPSSCDNPKCLWVMPDGPEGRDVHRTVPAENHRCGGKGLDDPELSNLLGR